MGAGYPTQSHNAYVKIAHCNSAPFMMDLRIGLKDTEFWKNCLSGFLVLLRFETGSKALDHRAKDEARMTNQ
jgi:hypothetical protein